MTDTATKTKNPQKPTPEAPPPNLPVEHVPHAPRLPYYSEFKERFGVDKIGWNALVNTVYPHAKSIDAVMMVLSYCQVRKLDPMKRPVHIVPMWDTKLGRYVDSVWPGINEVRTTAHRTNNYAGCDESEFGPDMTETFEGMVGSRDNKEKKTLTVTFPAWCQITVYRNVQGERCAFVGPKVWWLETYASIGGSKVPNDTWGARRTRGQLEKCAEAASLRKAFPEELGNTYAAEEMAGREVIDVGGGGDKLVEHKAAPEKTNGNGKTQTKLDAFGAEAEAGVDEAEVVQVEKPKKRAKAKDQPGMVYSGDESGAQLDALLDELKNPLTPLELHEIVGRWRTSVIMMIPQHQKQAQSALDQRAGEVGEPPLTFLTDKDD